MPQFEFVSRSAVEKGWSGDKKYCAITADGTNHIDTSPGTIASTIIATIATANHKYTIRYHPFFFTVCGFISIYIKYLFEHSARISYYCLCKNI